MNILILGGTGYLGGNIVNALSKQGYHIFCVTRPTSDTGRILREQERSVTFVPHEYDQVERVFRKVHFDCIINAVCTYKPNDTLYGDMLESNVSFPLRILNLAVQYHADHFLTIGTSLPAEFNVYSFTKARFTDFGRYLSGKGEIGFTELKLEMFYGGEHEPASRFLNACRQKLREGAALLLTEGTQKRDLIRVEDVVGVISRMLESPFQKEFRSLSLGYGQQHSIREIVGFMKEVSGSKSELRFGAVSMRQGEPDTIADIEWLKEMEYQLQYDYFSALARYMKEDQS